MMPVIWIACPQNLKTYITYMGQAHWKINIVYLTAQKKRELRCYAQNYNTLQCEKGQGSLVDH